MVWHPVWLARPRRRTSLQLGAIALCCTPLIGLLRREDVSARGEAHDSELINW
jgi:hypothetical protein